MKLSRLFLAVVAVAFLFGLAVSTARAGSMGNGAAQRMKLVVDSVDTTAGTVTLKSGVDQSVHAYKIDATTKITVGRAKGTIDQIVPGMKVANYASGGGQPPPTLTMIMVYEAAPVPVPPVNK